MIEYLEKIKNVKGIIQIGSNSGQELEIIKRFTNNIILVEPIEVFYDYLRGKCPSCKVIPKAVGEKNETTDFYLSSNNGESSSLLKPKNHTKYYPFIKFDKIIKVDVRTFDSLVDEYEIDLTKYNVLLTDTQGYDLNVLKSIDKNLNNFDLIISEYINSELYENDSNIELFKSFLIPLGFEFVDSFGENIGAGNCVFMKT
jgi:FkbM family methyltransferase